MATKKELATQKQEAASALALYGDYQGATGFEGTGSDDYILPFMKLLQKGSPEVDEDNSAYVDGAKAGMYYDTGTGEIFNEPIFVPCCYKRAMVEWKPIDDGGGFVAQHDVGYEAQFEQDDRGRWMTPEGNYIADTRYFFGLRVDLDSGTSSPCVVSFTSTQIKKSRQWMTRLGNLKIEDENGKPTGQTYPIFAHKWAFSSVGEENDKFSWKGYKIENAGLITDPSLNAAAIEATAMFSEVQSVKPPAEGEGQD